MLRALVNGVPCTVYHYTTDGWSVVKFNCFDKLFRIRNELIEVYYEN